MPGGDYSFVMLPVLFVVGVVGVVAAVVIGAVLVARRNPETLAKVNAVVDAVANKPK